MKKTLLYLTFFASIFSYSQVPVVESYFSSSATGTTITMTKPSGVEVGDLLLIMVATDDVATGDEFITTAGFTKLNEAGNSTSQCHVAVFYRIATGTESITKDIEVITSNDLAGVYARISGVDGTDPIDVTGADTITNGSTHTTSGVTTTTVNNLNIAVYGFDGEDGANFTDGSGSAFNYVSQKVQGSSGNGVGFTWSTNNQKSIGSTGTAKMDSSVTDGMAHFMFSITGFPNKRIFNINK